MKRLEMAPLVHVLAFLLVMVISYWVGPKLPIFQREAKVIGQVIFFLGMAMFAWVLTYLKKSFFGNVKPVSDQLVTGGPYRWVRHPLYLSMIVVLVGLVLEFRSLWGIVSTFALFIPATAYRASLEEKAPASQFGQEWEDYAHATSFLLPFLW